ncbi:glycosyltransferase family 2 protein [Nocardioides sediminis]|uniref:glycosyltransferase family 2 protein n=1 Tax=Nocardioides sediminis TaxID=433648 RepID=UPI000D2FBB52|nr:galactosyltransferase-related protein [Nocardioides sediminis]
MSVAVVTLVHGRRAHLRAQHASLVHGGPPDHYVVAAMGDPTVRSWRPGPPQPVVVDVELEGGMLPLAAARNAAASRALDLGADVLVFLDVDCLAGPSLVGAYAHAVRRAPDVLWSGPVTYLPPPGPDGYPLDGLDALDDPHPARPAPAPGEQQLGGDPDLFWSLSFALHADAWRRTGGFFEGYVGYGAEDTDFAATAASAGLALGWLGGARAYHQHHPTSSPPVEHLADILLNGALFRRRWGRWPMEGWLEAFERMGLVEREDGEWRLTPSGRTAAHA